MAISKLGWKRILLIGGLLIIIGAAVVWYLFSLTYESTGKVKTDHKVSAVQLIKAFQDSSEAANKLYTEKIVEVTGVITEIGKADTSINLKMADTNTGSYVIFAFEKDGLEAAKKVKAGDKVTVKGSCSGGNFSEILEAWSITFKRCIII